jgi:hypothetical protein
LSLKPREEVAMKTLLAVMVVAVGLGACVTSPKQVISTDRPRFVENQHQELVKRFDTCKTALELGWGELKLVQGCQIPWYAWSDQWHISIEIDASLQKGQQDALVEGIIRNLNYADESTNFVGNYQGLTIISLGRGPQDPPDLGLALVFKVLTEAGLRPVIGQD